MSESGASDVKPSSAPSAGALLRAARQAQGLHIAALAASIKVSQRKLEALEADRYDELAGGTFTRALAQSVCRALRIDAQPVLALLPPPDAVALDNVTGKLNAPYRERGSRDDQGLAATAQRGLLWAGVGLLVAAVITYFVPGSWLRGGAASWPVAASAPSLAVPAASAPAAVPAPVVAQASTPAAGATPSAVSAASAAVSAPVATEPTAAASAAAPPPPVATSTVPAPATMPAPSVAETDAPLRLSASAPAWIEVRDGGGRVVFSRTLLAGEAAGVAGALPLRLVVGNASSVQVSYRGKPVDLAASTRVNVARLALE